MPYGVEFFRCNLNTAHFHYVVHKQVVKCQDEMVVSCESFISTVSRQCRPRCWEDMSLDEMHTGILLNVSRFIILTCRIQLKCWVISKMLKVCNVWRFDDAKLSPLYGERCSHIPNLFNANNACVKGVTALIYLVLFDFEHHPWYSPSQNQPFQGLLLIIIQHHVHIFT